MKAVSVRSDVFASPPTASSASTSHEQLPVDSVAVCLWSPDAFNCDLFLIDFFLLFFLSQSSVFEEIKNRMIHLQSELKDRTATVELLQKGIRQEQENSQRRERQLISQHEQDLEVRLTAQRKEVRRIACLVLCFVFIRF